MYFQLHMLISTFSFALPMIHFHYKTFITVWNPSDSLWIKTQKGCITFYVCNEVKKFIYLMSMCIAKEIGNEWWACMETEVHSEYHNDPAFKATDWKCITFLMQVTNTITSNKYFSIAISAHVHMLLCACVAVFWKIYTSSHCFSSCHT